MSSVSASNIRMDYMKVLITQLQNQNPLEPLDNNEMASQLAQFSQLQQLESMNSNFAKVLAITNHSYANSLIGKDVTVFAQDTETGEL
ncbi:MAG: flagellar hook assembly protein FlgD, partial [Planctomycetota bacterium]